MLLVTCSQLAEGEPGHEALDTALDARGLDSRWVVWDDLDVDWNEAAVIAVRSTWDYDQRMGEFIGWASGLGSTLLNGHQVFRWNVDKRYLIDLHNAGVPVVPTTAADTVEQVRALAAQLEIAVVKPRVGAGGRGLEVVREAATWTPYGGRSGPWVVQPLVESIHHDGEMSVFVIAGHPVSQVDKLPSTTDIRVHEQFGGTSRPVPLGDDTALLATEAIAAVVDLIGDEIVYGRVDMMRHEGRLVVSEVEVTEPGLYLDVLPGNADPFADAVLAHVRS